MSLQSAISEKLGSAFSPTYVKVDNESHMHSVPPNSETHFKVTLVSDAFEGEGQIARHQSVYRILSDEMRAGVHALTLHLYTEKEWARRHACSPHSPQCLGGMKREQEGRS